MGRDPATLDGKAQCQTMDYGIVDNTQNTCDSDGSLGASAWLPAACVCNAAFRTAQPAVDLADWSTNRQIALALDDSRQTRLETPPLHLGQVGQVVTRGMFSLAV